MGVHSEWTGAVCSLSSPPTWETEQAETAAMDMGLWRENPDHGPGRAKVAYQKSVSNAG